MAEPLFEWRWSRAVPTLALLFCYPQGHKPVLRVNGKTVCHNCGGPVAIEAGRDD